MATVKCELITCDYNKAGYCTRSEISLKESPVFKIEDGEWDQEFYCANWTMNAREAQK